MADPGPGLEHLGPRVRRLREAQGRSQNALAHAAGVDAGQLSRLERGQARRPSHDTLAKLASALGVPLPVLTGAAAPDAGEAAATAQRWVPLVAALADVDVVSHLRTLARLSPAARADVLAYARWRAHEEHAAGHPLPGPRTDTERGEEARVLGEPPADPPEYRTAG